MLTRSLTLTESGFNLRGHPFIKHHTKISYKILTKITYKSPHKTAYKSHTFKHTNHAQSSIQIMPSQAYKSCPVKHTNPGLLLYAKSFILLCNNCGHESELFQFWCQSRPYFPGFMITIKYARDYLFFSLYHTIATFPLVLYNAPY
jgi:hypothetical protein